MMGAPDFDGHEPHLDPLTIRVKNSATKRGRAQKASPEEEYLVYAKLSAGKFSKTKEVYPDVFVDFDKKGSVIGVECIAALSCSVQPMSLCAGKKRRR